MKYFKRGPEIFQNFHEIFKYFKLKYFIVHLYEQECTSDELGPKPGFHSNATHATQSLALRKRKTQALDWLLR